VAARGAARVCLETGRRWTFASALDWPGWCRRGKGEEAALEALAAYAERYRAVVGTAFRPGPLTVVGAVPGTATTEFGAPDARGPWDDEPMPAAERRRQIELLEACWRRLDDVVAGAPAAQRRGPRGGGRDRDPIAEHVREAERSYLRMLGRRLPPGTPWPEQREALAALVREGAPEARWPLRYAVRRAAWHVLDHAWEIEDKSE